MMKRMMALLLGMLLLTAAWPAQAADELFDLAYKALYCIVNRTETGDVPLGSAVLFLDKNLLLTAESCCQQGNLYAIGQDGEYAILHCDQAGDSGAALMEMDGYSTAEPLMLSNYDGETVPNLFGADTQGNPVVMPMYQVLYAMYRGQNAFHLSSEEGVLPGAFVIDEKGQLLALVMCQQAEGIGMYAALESDTIYNALTGSSNKDVFLLMEIQWTNGLMDVTWQDQLRSTGLYYLTISGAENVYYTSYINEPGNKNIQLAVPPGHTYYLQVQWAESEAAVQPLNWSVMSTYTVPELPFNQYGFQQGCYLASAPKGHEVEEILPEMENIQASALCDQNTSVYLQILNTYDVEQEIELPMTVSLIAPDGQFFYEEMLYLFSPEYEQNDWFVLPLDDLLASCMEFSDQGKLMPGEYVLKYSIAGKLSGEYAFTLPESE